jgi:hypothetical protein
MNSTHICSPLDSVSQTLQIRQATTKFEIDELRTALNDEHYLKAGRPAGNTIWRGIYKTEAEEGYPVLCCVLCWSGAAPRLKDRDEWIGWDPLTRGSRLPLVSQLRRFIILESQREPNLATRCLGLALRTLPDHFEEKYNYRPILAESFSDPQLHEGTIYKASNWTPLGFSKGFKRHKSEFYIDEKSPKKYWIYPLEKKAQQLLSSPSPLPDIFQKGTSEGVAGARCALKCAHLRSLSDAFHKTPDHRSAYSRRYAKIAMFGLISHGLLVGSPTVKAIWKRSTALNQSQRKAIGLNVRNKDGRLIMPSYDAINNFVNGIDPIELEQALNQWLAVHQDKLPRSLALDGKDLGHNLGAIVTLCDHENARPVAMASYSGEKDDCELPIAQELLKQSHRKGILENSTITSDALHTQKKRIVSSMTLEQTASPPLKRTRKPTMNTQKIYLPVVK